MKNKFIANIALLMHFPVVITWFGLFFIPTSIWQGKITFHFWFIVIILFMQLLWGLILYPKTHKIDIICPLTTIAQYFRGYKISDKNNYDHSFISEMLNKLKIKVDYNKVNKILLLTVVIIIIQYIFFNI